MTVAEHLGRAAAVPRRDLPPAVRARARFLIADTVAVAVSGWQRAELLPVRSALLLGSEGPATVIGRPEGAAPAVAALVNSLPVAAEQLQDGHRQARGHPASHVVPAVLAASEAIGASGQDVLAAVLTGCEVGIRVGDAMGGTAAGVHDIGTWGAIGAAAGVAHLLSGGSADAIAGSIDLAAAHPLRPDAATVFGGDSGQHLLLALAVHHGLVAGTAAAHGLRAAPGTLERYFLPQMGRAPVPDRVTADAGPAGWEQYRILDGYVKRHPTCAHLHGINDAVEDLVEGQPVDPDRIESVSVATYEAAAAFDDPTPGNDLAARFSIPFTVAVGLATGELGPQSFASARLSDRRITDLASRVVVRHDPRLDDGYPAGRPAVVTVTWRDGTQRQARSVRPRGDGPDALDDPLVASKPERLLTRVVGQSAARAVLDAVAALELDGLPRLTAALRGLTWRGPDADAD